jgi:hypothetical protein
MKNFGAEYSIPEEMPSKEKQIEILEKKISSLEEELKKYNLPDDLPVGKEFLPAYLSDKDKEEILRIQRELSNAKSRLDFLENSK